MADRPPRLVYLCLQPTVEGQGSYAHVWGIVVGLRDLGWQVVVVQPPMTVIARGLGVRLGAFVRTQMRLARIARRADAVYVRMHPAAAPTVWWARRRGIRVVVEVNGPAEDWLLAWPMLQRVRWLLDWLLAGQLRAADHVIPVTTGLGEWASTMAGRTVAHTVIPNGVDTSRFYPGATGGPAGLPDRYAVFVGELTPWQGIDDLLGAFECPAWPEGLDLVVAGTGTAADRVAGTLSRPDRQVYAIGRISHDQVPGLLSAASVALVTSRDRAGTGVAPIKLFEALAVGTPIVATDVPDVDRYLDRPRVAPGDIRGWAQAVTELVEQSVSVPPAADHSWRVRAAQTAEIVRPEQAAAVERPEAIA